MSKYAWADMEPCKCCILKDGDPDLCHALGEKPVVKTEKVDWGDNYCWEWIRDSKWNRMPEEEKRIFLEDRTYLSQKQKEYIMSL